MELENKILSKEIQQYLYETDEKGHTVGTAESCTGGKIAETIMSVPGASNYYKGSVICYTNEVKERLLNVTSSLIEEKTAVSEDVAIAMVKGACTALNVDYAIATTGIAGPGGELPNASVGTIWIAYGAKNDIRTFKITENKGRDLNILNATKTALRLFLEYLKENVEVEE